MWSVGHHVNIDVLREWIEYLSTGGTLKGVKLEESKCLAYDPFGNQS